MTVSGAPDDSARRATAWAVAAGAILAQQVCSKAVRDSLFLSQLSVSALPQAMLAAAVLAVPSVLGVSFAIRRHGPGRVAPAVLLVSAVAFIVEWVLLPRAPIATAWIVYVHVATLGGITLSAFFSSLAEHFDPHSARRSIGRVMSGAALGGLAGGLLVTQAARSVKESTLLLVLGLSQAVCAAGLARIGGGAVTAAADPDTSSVVGSMGRSGYLQMIASLVLVTGFVSALLDFGFKASASGSVGSGPELLQLFAAFHTATALLTALVQATFAQRALERLGLAGTLAILPASVLLSAAFGVVLPPLPGRALVRGVSSVFESSLFRSAYEPLYTPLTPAARRATKTVIDVAAGRLGEALGSGVLLVLALLQPDARSATSLALATLGAAVALFLSLRLHGGYVAELATSLRSGAVSLREGDLLDSTTRLMLSQTQLELSRAEIVSQLAALRAIPATPTLERNLTSEASVPAVDSAAAAARREQDAAHARLLTAAGDLLSTERPRVLRVIEAGPLDPRLIAFAIPLLAHAALVAPVTAALRTVATEAVGQLVDALLDTAQPLLVRRRIPRILKRASPLRAAHGLWQAARLPERELRYRAASALADLIAQHPENAPPTAAVFELVREELRAPGGEPNLHHVFALLSLVLERDALRFARRALASDDGRQRGTALEYLHSTLPEPLRSELITQLESGPLRPGSVAPPPRPSTA